MNRNQITREFLGIYPDASCGERLMSCHFAFYIAEMARKEALEEAAKLCDYRKDNSTCAKYLAKEIRRLIAHETPQSN